MQSSYSSENSLPPQSLCASRVPPWGADSWAAGSHPGSRTHTAFLSLGVSALCARGFVLSSPCGSRGPSGRSGSHLCALGRGVDMNLASEEAGAGKCSRAKTPPDRTAWPSAHPASPAPWGEPMRAADGVAASGPPGRTGSQLPLPWDAGRARSSLQAFLPPQWRRDLPSLSLRGDTGVGVFVS